ncbi:MAG: F0F1 ATP synthase subunit epsilon [Gammaproteobacteria bacterium]|nr:F0F1 ATP synthase subunit epsilon [Gammaproteobacteria bacterium]MDE2263451.1 F0F1 ATP synthase subunit epsilon [Gammaproteobacteria bacterium]
MRLDITTPFTTVLRTEAAVHVRAEDSSGAFGILPGHADFLTVLSVSVLTWRDMGNREHYVAVRGGMLSVHDGRSVSVAAPEAVAGEDLHRLEAEVLTRFQRQVDEERAAHTADQRLHLAAIRQIMRLLRPEPGHAPTVG